MQTRSPKGLSFVIEGMMFNTRTHPEGTFVLLEELVFQNTDEFLWQFWKGAWAHRIMVGGKFNLLIWLHGGLFAVSITSTPLHWWWKSFFHGLFSRKSFWLARWVILYSCLQLLHLFYRWTPLLETVLTDMQNATEMGTREDTQTGFTDLIMSRENQHHVHLKSLRWLRLRTGYIWTKSSCFM